MMTLLPPPQYDFPPPMPVIEHVVDLGEVMRQCWKITNRDGVNHMVIACALPWNGTCIIWRPEADPRSGISAGQAADLRRHELAHCNGWPEDHPGGR